MYPLSRHTLGMLLFFYLFSSYVSATHIHSEPFVVHSDCKVCIVAKSLHSNDPTPHTSPLQSIEYAIETFFLKQYTPSYLPNKGFNAHAPPA